MHDPHLVAVEDRLQDLLDTVAAAEARALVWGLQGTGAGAGPGVRPSAGGATGGGESRHHLPHRAELRARRGWGAPLAPGQRRLGQAL